MNDIVRNKSNTKIDDTFFNGFSTSEVVKKQWFSSFETLMLNCWFKIFKYICNLCGSDNSLSVR